MIVVVTGTAQPFDRLIAAVRDFAAKHPHEDLWVQHGNASLPAPLIGAPVVPYADLMARVRAAEAVVCHAGCGTLHDALAAGHVPVVMPRLARHGEHVNDHQLEIWEALRAERRIVGFSCGAELAEALAEARGRGRQSVGTDGGRQLADALGAELLRHLQPGFHRRRRDHLLRVVGWLSRWVPLLRLSAEEMIPATPADRVP